MDQSAISRSRRARARLVAARRLVWVVPAGLGALVLGLQQSGEWKPPDWLVWVAVLSGTASILIEGLLGVFRESSSTNAPYDAGDRQKFMAGCAVEVHQRANVPIASLGLSLWVIHRPRTGVWSHVRSALRLRRPSRPDPFLYRIERFRPSDPPATSEAWVAGRGVIGECVANNKMTFRDYRPVQRDYPSGTTLSASQWKDITKADRDDGFSKQDFVRMIHRYEQVFAYPITDGDGRVVGCVSLDVTAPAQDSSAAPQASINSKPVVTAVHSLAGSMSATAQALAVRP